MRICCDGTRLHFFYNRIGCYRSRYCLLNSGVCRNTIANTSLYYCISGYASAMIHTNIRICGNAARERSFYGAVCCNAITCTRFNRRISGDAATSESALQHALEYLREKKALKPSLVVFLQATSPLRQPHDIQNAIETLEREQADSLFSACLLNGFLWRNENGKMSSLSYDYRYRQRRQDAPEIYDMNALIYIYKRDYILNTKSILGNKTILYEMPEITTFDIDREIDFKIIELLLKEEVFEFD